MSLAANESPGESRPKTPRGPRRRVPRASVLILIVALLTLLALMGTSFLTTTRTDLHASHQHLINTRIDMAVESAVGLVVADLTDSIIRPDYSYPLKRWVSAYRRPDLQLWWSDAPTYILSSRVPVLPDPTKPPDLLYPVTPRRPLLPAEGGVNPPLWLNVRGFWGDPSGPLSVGNATWPDGRQVPPRPPVSFDSPTYWAPTVRPYLGEPAWPFLQPYSQLLMPLDMDLKTGDIDPVPAADADGDGIADSMLFSIPPAPTDSLTFYYAVRIIDNNSAVNVNTAMARNHDFDGMGKATTSPWLFKGRVGLADLLRTHNADATSLAELGDEMARLNAYRLNDPKFRVAGVVGAAGLGDRRFKKPWDDQGAERDDFLFTTVGEALERQLGVRVANPGVASQSRRFRPIALADQMALAQRFCLASPNASPTLLEQTLRESLSFFGGNDGLSPVPTQPYEAGDVARWMDRFDYDKEDPEKPRTFRDRRALLVARNPISNHAPTYMTDALAEAAGMPPFNDQSPRRFQTRVSINSAPFNDLWRGFWSVFNGNRRNYSRIDTYMEPQEGPYRDKSIGRLDPYIGMKFSDDFRPIPGEIHPRLMLRCSIRDVRDKGTFDRGPLRFVDRADSSAMALLRAALAAVNTEDLRDTDNDVTTHLIRLDLKDSSNTLEKVVPWARVRVYGFERQPFITEIYANTDTRTIGPGGSVNPKGYVAIELHNPYDADINLGPPPGEEDGQNGWSVGLIDRLSAGAAPPNVPAKPKIKLLNLDGSAPGSDHLPWRFPVGTVVPAHGYLVLENYPPAGSAEGDAAAYRPEVAAAWGLGSIGDPHATGHNLRVVYVPHLSGLLAGGAADTRGGEFVLLRTRRADGRAIDASKDAVDRFNERLNLYDLVPVDQFDFTGVGIDASPSPTFLGVHYVRANDVAGGGAWKFVYPGRYDGARLKQRHQGMVQVAFQPPQTDAAFASQYTPPVRLGLPDATAHPNQGSFPIQLWAADFPGPDRPRDGVNLHPFGLFARDGDILQVPFIGAYTIFTPTSKTTPPFTPNANGELFEINAITMDSAFAEDTDTRDDWPARPGEQCEQIGRFCPVKATDPNDPRKQLDDYDSWYYLWDYYPHVRADYDDYIDYVPDGAGPLSRMRYLRYAWAAALFEYLTVESPHNDFLPNVPPSFYHTIEGKPILPRPQAVSNAGGTAGNADPLDAGDSSNDNAELTQPIEGRININTAPWKVLATLPLVVDPVTGKVDRERNDEMAKAIAYFRDFKDDIPLLMGDPPKPYWTGRRYFWSIFGLNDVVDTRPLSMRPEKFRHDDVIYSFRNSYGLFQPEGGGGAEPGTLGGDVSPYRPAGGSANDGVRGDFEEQFLNVIRLSNLVTVHSDSSTCYVLVLGIENAGTPEARVKVKRRVGFILDRSALTPDRPVPRIQYFSRE